MILSYAPKSEVSDAEIEQLVGQIRWTNFPVFRVTSVRRLDNGHIEETCELVTSLASRYGR